MAEQAATYAMATFAFAGLERKRLIRRRGGVTSNDLSSHYLEALGMRLCRTHPCRKTRKYTQAASSRYVAGFNLGILMRNLIGKATPKRIRGARDASLIGCNNGALRLATI